MSSPFIGEIRIFGGNFAPRNHAFCNGQLLSIAQNTALFSLLGTTYGGNGQSTFALPDLRSRVPVHFGIGTGLSTYYLGQSGGEAAHTLTVPEIAPHSHPLVGVDTATTTAPSASAQLGAGTDFPGYYAGAANTTMNTAALSPIGSGLAHENTAPILGVNFIIVLQGIFPSRN